ncbi:MAG: YceI family protein [Vicinamibacterales bacterium]
MSTANAVATRTFQFDRAHSEVAFTVRHLISRVRGTFGDFSGTIAFDEERPERSTVAVDIQAASIDTGVDQRDAHLRSDDFFAAEQYPLLTFRSTAIVPRGGDAYDVTGDLTIRGVTKSVVIPVSLLGKAKDPWGQEKLAFEGEVTLNRKDFGLNWNAVVETGGFLVGDEVKVSLLVQAAPVTEG